MDLNNSESEVLENGSSEEALEISDGEDEREGNGVKQNGEFDCRTLTSKHFNSLLDIIKINEDINVESIVLTMLNDHLETDTGKQLFQTSNGIKLLSEKLVKFNELSILRKILDTLDRFYCEENSKINYELNNSSGKSCHIKSGTAICLDNCSDLLRALTHVSFLSNQDIELSRLIVKFTLRFCKSNRNLSQRKCILTILMKCLDHEDSVVISASVLGLYYLVSTRDCFNFPCIDDVINSGICQKLPNLLDCDDVESKIYTVSIINNLQEKESGVELVHEMNLLPKFTEFLTSNNHNLQKAGLDAIYKLSNHSMNIHHFHESPYVISELCELALSPSANIFSIREERSVFLTICNIVKFSSDEQKIQMIREGGLMKLNNVLLLYEGKYFYGKRKLKEAVDELHSLVIKALQKI